MDEEKPLGKNSEENGDGKEGANRRTGGGNGGQRAAGGNARVRDQAKPMHGHEDTVDAGEGNPEVKFTQRLVRGAAEKFGEPEKQRAKDWEPGRGAHEQKGRAGYETAETRGAGDSDA